VQRRRIELDSITRILARHSLGLRFEDLPERIVTRTKQAVLDSLGCAVAGYTSESSRIVQDTMKAWPGEPEATVIGTGARTSCLNAVLANGVMLRYLDLNDTVTRPRAKGTHPSEVIPLVLALGEMRNHSGKELVATIALGYELLARFVQGQAETAVGSHSEGQYGWANSIWFPYVLPLLAARLLGLNEDQAVNAVGLCGIQNLTLGVIDSPGETYNMAKNIQIPFIAQSAIRTAYLARDGFTGPERVIEGNKAFYELVLRNEYDLASLTEDLNSFSFDKLHVIKKHAVETGIQATIDATLRITGEHGIGPSDVESIRVRTNRKAFLHTSDPLKRHPANKETADHSHAYTVAVAIKDGRLGPEQYSPEKLSDPEIYALADRVSVEADPEFENMFPASQVEISTRQGKVFTCRVSEPKGSPSNPLTDGELAEKFRSLALTQLGEERTQELIRLVSTLQEQSSPQRLMELLAWDKY
jgi:2-methylcitrate dehydratase